MQVGDLDSNSSSNNFRYLYKRKWGKILINNNYYKIHPNYPILILLTAPHVVFLVFKLVILTPEQIIRNKNCNKKRKNYTRGTINITLLINKYIYTIYNLNAVNQEVQLYNSYRYHIDILYHIYKYITDWIYHIKYIIHIIWHWFIITIYI